MLQSGDVCIVNEYTSKSSSGIYRSLIGKQVMITSSYTVNDKYPFIVINPKAAWEYSGQLQLGEECLTKEC